MPGFLNCFVSLCMCVYAYVSMCPLRLSVPSGVWYDIDPICLAKQIYSFLWQLYSWYW